MSTLLSIYIQNKQIWVRLEHVWTCGSLSEREHWASLKLMFITAMHKGWRHVDIDVNHNARAYLLHCLKRGLCCLTWN